MKKLFEILLFLAFIFVLPNSLFSNSFTNNFKNDTNFYGQLVFEVNKDTTKNIQNSVSIFIEDKTEASFNVFPNPATEKLFVRFSNWMGVKEIKLLDITGRSVFLVKSIEDNYEIDITTFPKGIYLISVKNELNNVVRKIKIQ